MSRRLLALPALFAACLVFAGTAGARAVPGQYIVVVKDGFKSGAVAAEHARWADVAVVARYRHALNGYSARLSPGALAKVRADHRVLVVVRDRTVRAMAQTLPTGVDRIEGDLSNTVSGNGSGSVNAAVAVLDTGIDLGHPDLNVVGGKNCSTGKGYNDGNGHGTHVAGTIGAKDDGNGVVGVAPGARLYAVRVLNNAGTGSWSSIICGIDWVTANAAARGIKVANMSLGGSGSDTGCNGDPLHRAICNSVNNAKVTYVVAAGNSAANLANFVPAAFNEVLAVTAVADFNGRPGGGAPATCRSDVDETPADFSNFTTAGSSDAAHTVAGPGVCIHSTWKGGGYKAISGTSMASPHVAGTAALCILGPCAGMTPAQVMSKLRSDAASRPASYGFSGDPNSPSGTRYYGYLAFAGGY
jgi:subtilisin